ncbi:MAG: putative DNA binding domain-containing protein, partial [Clostridia bacterium]|nr:putative DNA binding domain-containing protein [Clostridia bacterium]
MSQTITTELMDLIKQGEGVCVEFKKAESDIPKNVYETVCSFLNREGGHIFLGVSDNGSVIGINEDSCDKMIKDFVTSVNNGGKINPAIYIKPEVYDVDGKTIMDIYVPRGHDVDRCNNRFYDRLNESDIDISNHTDAVFSLYKRKTGAVYVDTVTRYWLDDLRPDLIQRARDMTTDTTEKQHPWKSMSDEELLRSVNLILRDEETGKEGVTIAGVLLFGKDNVIMAVLPWHKTDAIVRIINQDRYDEREIVSTNLLDSYDRLMEFGKNHLNSTFRLDGVQRVNARNHILREIVSNLLSHRDYSSRFVAKMVIEQDDVYTENANVANGIGPLNMQTLNPKAKNPPIADVFREIGLADELGSGIRNTYKYTRLYSDSDPQFVEGDVFRTVIPIPLEAIVKGGLIFVSGEQEKPDTHDSEINTIENQILEYCTEPRTRTEIQEFLGFASRAHFKIDYLDPLLNSGKIKMTIPDRPNSKHQKYV